MKWKASKEEWAECVIISLKKKITGKRETELMFSNYNNNNKKNPSEIKDSELHI